MEEELQTMDYTIQLETIIEGINQLNQYLIYVICFQAVIIGFLFAFAFFSFTFMRK